MCLLPTWASQIVFWQRFCVGSIPLREKGGAGAGWVLTYGKGAQVWGVFRTGKCPHLQ